MPTTDTVVIAASGGDYTSLFSAEAGEQRDLAASDEQINFDCGPFQDTTPVSFAGWTTSSTCFIRIQAQSGHRHSGVWNASVYRLVATSTTGTGLGCLDIQASHVRVEGLQVHKNLNGNGNAVSFYSSGANSIHYASGCIIRGTGAETGFARGILASQSNGAVSYFYNNIIYDIVGTHAATAGIAFVYGAYGYNNTIVNCTRGCSMVLASGAVVIKNNLIRSCTTAASGTFAAGTNNNATDNASMGYTVTGGGNTGDHTSQTFTFVNEAGDNFQITSADTGAKGYGLDLSADANLPVTTDITGAARSTPYDIGAFKFASSFQPAWGARASQIIGVSCA